MAETGLVEAGGRAVQLYGDSDDLRQMAETIKRFAAWAHDKQYPMTDGEIVTVVMRAQALGLDPLNPHEVQIWKDKHGVHFQEAYTLLVEFVRRFCGEHTNPIYRELDEDEKREHGIPVKDHAMEARFLMKSDLPMLRDLRELGYSPEEARRMLEKTGVGTVSERDWSGDYFAPNARSRRWKLEKRALTDAYRRAFGTPSKAQIQQLRRDAGVADLQAEDWSDTQRLSADSARALAQSRARWREHDRALATDPEYRARLAEQTRVGAEALYGPEPEAIEGEVVEDEAEEPEAEDEVEPEVEDEIDLGAIPVPAWVLSLSWPVFKAKMVQQIPHYAHDKHIIGALRKERGDDFRPWEKWGPAMAAECYRVLVGRLGPEERGQDLVEEGEQTSLPW